MAKKIKLTNDEIDSLTRMLDDQNASSKDEMKWTEDKDLLSSLRAGIRYNDRLGKKLGRMYRQQNKESATGST